jgi:membrane protease YdiL (CAAX protease family)
VGAANSPSLAAAEKYFSVVLWENAREWPRFLRDVQGPDPGRVRVAAFWRATVNQWALFSLTVFAWSWQGRAFTTLPLYSPEPWRAAVGALLATGAVAIAILQVRAVRSSAEARAALRGHLAGLDAMLPRTRAELAGFRVLSVTAGVCEEWLFRGVLIVLLAGWFGLPVAVALSALAFGLAHAYQGPAGIARSAIVGLAMSGVVLLSGSLVPAMIAHAAIDLGSGAAACFVATTNEGPEVDVRVAG